MIFNYDKDNGLTSLWTKYKETISDVSEEANNFFNTISTTDDFSSFIANFNTSECHLLFPSF